MYVSILWPYAALCYAYEIKIKKQEKPTSRTYVFKTLKIESMHVHRFIIKIEVAGTTTMTY